MKCLPLERCWNCSHYNAGNIRDEGYYAVFLGHCKHPEIGSKLITEFINGNGLPNWCPLSEMID
jgi:hypothetical protein